MGCEKNKKVVRSVGGDWGVNGERSGEGAEWGGQCLTVSCAGVWGMF